MARGTAWDNTTSGVLRPSQSIDTHTGSWKVSYRLDTTVESEDINLVKFLTSVSIVTDYRVKSSSQVLKELSLPDSVWDIPNDGVLQLRAGV